MGIGLCCGIAISSYPQERGVAGPDAVTRVARPSVRGGFMVTRVETEEDAAAPVGAVSIVLADDHEVVRNGLRMVLEAEDGFEVVAEAGDLEATRRYVRAHRPRVLVLDLNLPEGSSLPAIPELREQSPETAVVVLTMQQDPAFAREAMRAGALGYVLKHSAGNELVDAVRAAAAGETYLNPKLGAQLAAAPPEPEGPPDGLTEREVEILRLIALGHTNSEIGEQLYLSVRTIESHRAHIQQKTSQLDARGAGPLRARPRPDRVGGHGDRGTRPGGQRDRVGHRHRRPAGIAARVRTPPRSVPRCGA